MDMFYKLVESFTAQAVNLIAGMLIYYLVSKLRGKKKENNALRFGMQALLRDRIIQAYNHYVVEKKWIPIYAKESITHCHECYEALGENGVIDDLMKAINDLPNYPKEGKKKNDETD